MFFFYLFYFIKKVTKGLFHTLQKSPKINEGGDFCFYFIDMAIKTENEAPSEEMRRATRTKFLTLCGLIHNQNQPTFVATSPIE